jgi:hypothetical protein
MVQQIVSETQANRELSHPEIGKLASMLNLTLSEYERRSRLRSEPTPQKLRKQVSDLHKALRKLKLAFPDPEANSLRNYLIDLGEFYAETKGPHPNLSPHYVLVSLDTGQEGIDHYRSDVRVDEMISCVSQVLEWMNNTPSGTKKISYWWDRPPHWLDDQTVWDRLEYGFSTEDVERHYLTVTLIGRELPSIYQSTFSRSFGVSRTASGKYGPGVRFVASVLRHAGMNVRPETIIRYRTRAKALA